MTDPAAGVRPADVESWRPSLHRFGLRVTAARVLVLHTLAAVGHGTPEQIFGRTKVVLPGLSLSTVYRTLESLAEQGMVTHTHLDQHVKTYMLAEHADHAHLVCRDCHDVLLLDHDIAEALARQIKAAHGFDVDAGHLSVFGRCARCAGRR